MCCKIEGLRVYSFKYTCTIERIYVKKEEIPALVFYKDGAPKPVVICQHGFTGKKEDVLSTCLRLADAGFVAVAIDAAKHGERSDRDLLVKLRENPILFLQILLGTVEDIRKVIDYLEQSPKADLERVGMMGVSMGGIITLLTATLEERVKAIVSVIGGGDYRTLIKKSSLNKVGLSIESLEKLGESAKEFVKKYDPINNVHRFRSMPILLLNGELDDIIPLECASSLYNALKPLYKSAPDKLKMKVYPKIGHEYTPKMETDAVEWFRKHLLQ